MEQIIKQILSAHITKINLFVVGRVFLEILLFFVVLRLVNKAFILFFEKIVSKINDEEVRKQYRTLRQLGTYIIDILIILFFATNILESLGIDMKPILATAGVVGVAVGFGGKKIVEDIFTGLSIILSGQLRLGDFVTVNNSTGTVEKITLTMIVIRTFNGDVHYLRNGQIDTIINQTKDFSFPVFKVGVAYKSDITHVINVLNQLGKELRDNPEYGKYVLSDIEVCGLNTFNDSSLEILYRIKTTPHEQWMIRRKFNQMVKERFEQEGIEIPFPQVVIHEEAK